MREEWCRVKSIEDQDRMMSTCDQHITNPEVVPSMCSMRAHGVVRQES